MQIGEHNRPYYENESIAGDEISVLEERRTHEALFGRGQHVNHEPIESHCRDDGLDPDFRRTEPVLQLTAIEHNLKGSYRHAQRTESKEVETRLANRRLGKKTQNAEKCQYAERHVDIKHPAPIVVLGQPAAEGGTDN